MPLVRRFLISPSLTRLIGKEFGSYTVIEGHFAPQADRQSYVRLDQGRTHLVLASLNAGPQNDEASTEVPAAHAEALLEVCPGKLTLERSIVPVQAHAARVDRLISPGPLDLVSIEFIREDEATRFVPPVWFGAEVTPNDSYINRVMALTGLPDTPETEASNAGMEAVLDIMEGVALRECDVQRPFVSAPPQVASPFSLPRASALTEILGETTAFDAERRRPVLQALPAQSESDDTRLARVIDGLSSALSTTPPENGRPAADVEPRQRWRRPSH